MSAQIHPTKYDIAIPSMLLVTHLHLRRSRGVKILQQCWLLFRNISKLVAVEPPIKQKHACENGWTSCMFVNSRGETSSHIFEECITFFESTVCIRTTMVSKHILIWLRGIRKKKRFWNSSAIIAFKWYDLRHSRCPIHAPKQAHFTSALVPSRLPVQIKLVCNIDKVIYKCT